MASNTTISCCKTRILLPLLLLLQHDSAIARVTKVNCKPVGMRPVVGEAGRGEPPKQGGRGRQTYRTHTKNTHKVVQFDKLPDTRQTHGQTRNNQTPDRHTNRQTLKIRHRRTGIEAYGTLVQTR